MNIILLTGVLIFLETNILGAFADTTIERCKTPAPENGNGWCVPLLQCKIISDISGLPLSSLPLKYQDYIMNAKCGYDSEKKYCCLLKHINPSFARINGLTNPSSSSPKPTPGIINHSNINNKPSGDKLESIPNAERSTTDIDLHQNLKLLPNDCGEIADKYKVSFGELAGVTEFPFMVLLQFNRKNPNFACGGTLINENYVLTAAHCATSSLFSVRLGEHTIDKESDCELDEDDEMVCNDPVQDIPIQSRILHKNFNRFKAENDIALLRLTRPANMNVNNVKTICLPTTSKIRDQVFKIGQVSGWGYTENGTSTSLALLKGKLMVNREREKCVDLYSINHSVNVTDRIICATGENNVDSCRGDSGGPLLQQAQLKLGEFKKYLQFGIVASGPRIKCGDANQSGGSLYTNIPRYMRWILDNLKP